MRLPTICQRNAQHLSTALFAISRQRIRVMRTNTSESRKIPAHIVRPQSPRLIHPSRLLSHDTVSSLLGRRERATRALNDSVCSTRNPFSRARRSCAKAGSHALVNRSSNALIQAKRHQQIPHAQPISAPGTTCNPKAAILIAALHIRHNPIWSAVIPLRPAKRDYGGQASEANPDSARGRDG